MLENVEFVEYSVRDLAKTSALLEKMGFELMGSRNEDTRKSKLYGQGDIRIALVTGSNESDAASRFVRTHGDGISMVGYRVADAGRAFKEAVQKGAIAAFDAKTLGDHRLAALSVFGDVHYGLASGARYETLFTEDRKSTPLKGRSLQTVDHLTVNVEKGTLDKWADYHADIFGFHQVRYFDIRTERTGLLSRAMRSPSGRVTIPFNEPTNPKSQIQEFLDVFKGPGVQHLAFHTPDIVNCLTALNTHGFKFLTVPDTYYDAVPKRVPNVTEDMDELKKLGILVDGSDKGYLLQIFTESLVGPFFFEFIQRKGDNGFGDGNFRALFEAIERDQERRGVL